MAWWAKSRIGAGKIPNTTVKATHRPMATAVSGGTGTGPRASTSAAGGGVGQHLEAGHPSRRCRSAASGVVVGVRTPLAESPPARHRTSPTGENIVTARRR